MKKNGLARSFGNWILKRPILIFKLTTILCFFSLMQVSATDYSEVTKNTFKERINVHAESAQQKNITGKVTDTDGQPLPGVTVVVKGTTTGTVTNADGNYLLTNSPENATLVFSFVGMTTKEVIVGTQTNINITMEADVIGIGEVVAIGYGTMKKSDLTGAISSVKVEQIENEKPQAIQDILRGNVTGIDVGRTTSAKGGGSLQIRGDNTLKTSSEPLIVLDGVIYPGELVEINPTDIQSIDFLKDASSAAVYGAQAANGVIVITTKKGKIGKPTINLTSSVGVATMATMPDVYDPEGFMSWRQDVIRSLNYYNPNTMNKLYMFDNPDNLPDGITMDMWKDGKTGEPIDIWLARLGFQSMEVENYKKGNSTDWADMVFQNGLRQDHTLSLSGKQDNLSYYWSVGYLNNEGIVVGDQFKTIRSRLNLDAKISDWLSVGLNTQFANRDEGNIVANWHMMWRVPPYGDQYAEDGKLRHSPTDNWGSGIVHPLYDKTFQDRRNMTNSFINSIYAITKLPFGITYQFTFAPRFQWSEYMNHQSAEHAEWSKIGGRAERQKTNVYSWQIDNVFKWEKTFNEIHSFNATFLINAEKYQSWQESMSIQQFDPTDAMGYHFMQAGTGLTGILSSNDQYSTGDALMGRLFYSLKNRYMTTISVRRDGYSAFGLENPRGIFPAAAFAWTFTEENMLKNDFLTYGKLRFSWGENGNRSVGRYVALSNMGINKYPYQTLGGVTFETNTLFPSNMANAMIKWERTQSTNIGLDFSLKNGLFDGSIEVYNSRTLDLLADRAIPSILGYSPATVTSNLGEIGNKGFEFNLNARLIKRQNFNWQANFNFSLNRNKIVHLYGNMVDVLDDNGNVVGQKEADDRTNKWFIDHAIDEIWEPVILGVWQIGEEEQASRYGQYPGDFKLKDVNDDGKINEEDHEFQGFQQPRFRWHMRHDFKIYRNFDFSFSMYSLLGHKGIFNSAKGRDGRYPDRFNSYVFPYWTPENPTNDYARIFSSEGGAVFNVWRDKTFIRFDKITLAYTMPKATLPAGISGLKFMATIDNVGFWAPKWEFWDPEFGEEWGYWDDEHYGPNPRYFTLGINLTL